MVAQPDLHGSAPADAPRDRDVQSGLESIGTVGPEVKEIDDASRHERPQAQPHQQPPQGDVRQHGGGADQARADQDDAAQGQGSAPRRREADHPGQARRPACPPPGDLPSLQDDELAGKLFGPLAERYPGRQGGYTRVLKAGFRYGDNAPMAIIEFVDRDPAAKGQDSGPVAARPRLPPTRTPRPQAVLIGPSQAVSPMGILWRTRFRVPALLAVGCSSLAWAARRRRPRAVPPARAPSISSRFAPGGQAGGARGGQHLYPARGAAQPASPLLQRSRSSSSSSATISASACRSSGCRTRWAPASSCAPTA